MDAALGLLALAGYIVAIVSLAAGVTYAVIKIFPTERRPKKEGETETKPAKEEQTAPADADAPAGNLFRRSKRDRS